ncbi:MAG TPA: hypothetical protein VKT82_18275 [Ktedonobacterales bacterium]|nr:hypothetical protein [Ktedonobacterales bacterium]
MRTDYTPFTGSEIKPMLVRLPRPRGRADERRLYRADICAARRITQRRANIQQRAEVGKNPAWPDGFPNSMSYFFSVLEERLGLKAAP